MSASVWAALARPPGQPPMSTPLIISAMRSRSTSAEGAAFSSFQGTENGSKAAASMLRFSTLRKMWKPE